MNFGINDMSTFDSYIRDFKVKADSEASFKSAVLELKKIISKSDDYKQISEAKATLEDLKDRISEECSEIQTLVSSVIRIAIVHLHTLESTKSSDSLKEYQQQRIEILQKIPDKRISLKGSGLNLENSFLLEMLEGHEQEYSLKKICGSVSFISNEQLSDSIEVAEKLIESLKDEGRVLDLIQFCSGDLSKVQILFALTNYLNLSEFQDEFLEPFNKVFSETSLEYAPVSIRQLDLSKQNVEGIDFSRFDNLKKIILSRAQGLSAAQFNTISPAAKASIEILDLSEVGARFFTLFGMDVTDFDFSAFTSLKTLNLYGVRGLTAEQFNGILSSDVETLDLREVDVTGFEFSGFTSLKTLTWIRYLTATQFNAVPASAKAFVRNLDLSHVNVTDFNFSEFTNLEALYLNGIQSLISLPENIGEFTSLREVFLKDSRGVISLPTSITNLSSSCSIDIRGSGLSEAVRVRLQEITNVDGYQGPRFIFSMEHLNPQECETKTIEELLTNLYSLAKEEQPILEDLPKEEKLRVWLSRLSYMADYNAKGERQEKLAKSVVDYLERANEDPRFRESFLCVINGAADTCGDRMALSVVNLSVDYQIQTADLSDMKSLSHLLSRGVWAMNTLENIAREKVTSLPFVDEIEVYLGYPTMLKDRLELPINIGEMLYFRCSGITQGDLNRAEELVKDQLGNREELVKFLAGHDKWVEALRKNNLEEMKMLEEVRDKAKESYLDGELDLKGYQDYEKDYNKGINSLTIKKLR
jgi:uncharacterized protein YjbI with pentapeptide repeats